MGLDIAASKVGVDEPSSIMTVELGGLSARRRHPQELSCVSVGHRNGAGDTCADLAPRVLVVARNPRRAEVGEMDTARGESSLVVDGPPLS